MALTVVVRSGDTDSPPTITFDAPRIVIGRGEGCEVRLPDPSVSHRHASIRQRGADYIVLDEGSTNGTFVGPVRLAPQASRVLKSGDRLRVGRIWLEVLIEAGPAAAKPSLATKEMALALVASALRAQGQDAQLLVSVVEGPDTGLGLALTRFDKQYVIGRGAGADLQLTDADASRRHVRLERRGDRVEVLDLGSKNGASLGGTGLAKNKPSVWKPDQRLEIGGNQLTYADPVTQALSELETAPDELLDPLEAIDPPSDAASDELPHSAAADVGVRSPLVALDESPRQRARAQGVSRWLTPDLLVMGLSLVVLVLSVLGLFWLFSGP